MNMMKSRRNNILLLLTTMLCLGAEPSQGSVLSDTANAMAPGTWAALSTNGLNASFFDYPGGNGGTSTAYLGAVTWDPTTRQVIFYAAGHINPAMLHKYSESTNTWTRDYPLPIGGRHGYYHNAIDINRRILGVYIGFGYFDKYNIDTGTWGAPTASMNLSGRIASGLIYFPARDRWYVADGTDNSVREYNPNTNTWVTFATNARCFSQPGQTQHSYYHQVSAYNPVRSEIVFGGGNTSIPDFSFSLCKMDANGTITVLPVAPVQIGVQYQDSNGGNLTIDPASGDALVLTQHGQFYKFSFTTNTWSLIPNHATMPASLQQANNNINGGFVAPISTYGVVMYMKWPSELYLYKHAQGGTPVTSPSAVDALFGIGSLPPGDMIPPNPPTQLTLKTSGNPPPALGVGSFALTSGSTNAFAVLCALPTTIFCQDFDVLPQIDTITATEGIFNNNFLCAGIEAPGEFCPEIDNGTLKHTIASKSGAGASGQYYVKFADLLPGGGNIPPGQSFFFQWKEKQSASFLFTRYNRIGGGWAGGWKQAIVGTAFQSSCSENDIVLQNSWQRGVPQMYHACGYYEGFEVGAGSDIDMQPGGELIGSNPICSYVEEKTLDQFANPPQYPSGCWGYAPDEWATYQIGIDQGLDGQNTRIRLWAKHPGQPSVLVIDHSRVLYGGTLGFGKITLLPYHSYKDPSQVHPEGYVWYDQLIISRTQIPDR